MKEWPEELRPRLSPEVHVRLHHTSEDFAEAEVVLYGEAGELAVIDGRAWRMLSCCDGTRDVEGVRRAAAARGTHTSVEQLRLFLGQLYAAGCLLDGPELPPGALPSSPAPERPIVGLPGFALECDGQGSCCRFFETMTFRPDEVVRARATMPEVNGAGAHPWQGFSPIGGSESLPWRASAVATRDGRCSYLDDDGACGLHRRGGAACKPLGCRVFPAIVVDTGDELRVGPRPECACVFRSGRTDAATVPLMEHPLDPGVVIERLPEHVDVGAVRWPLERYRRWSAEAEPSLAWLESQATALGADPRRALETLRAAAAASRRPAGLYGRVLGALETEEQPQPTDEAFYLRAVAFAHLWALDRTTLAESLARRAAVIRLGRCLRLQGDAAADAPLALAEALARRLHFIG